MSVLKLNEEEQRWIEIARKLAEDFKVADRSFDEKAEFTWDNFRKLKDSGLLKLAVPKEYGGESGPNGNTYPLVYRVSEEISRGCTTTGWNLIIHYHQCGAVARLGNEEQKSRILGDVARNGAIMGSLGSEVNHQQAVASKDTKTKLVFNAGMEPVDGGFRANASKHFCSNGPVADYLLYWSIAPGASSSSEGLTLSIVTKDSPGLEFMSNGWDKIIGLRGTVSWSATLKDVFIPWTNVLGEPADFIKKDPYTLELSQSYHLLGCAEAAYDIVLQVLKDRPFLQKEDGLMLMLGEMDAKIQSVKGSCLYACAFWEDLDFGAAALASLKAHHLARDTAIEVATKAFDIIGTRALLNTGRLEMIWRDVRAASLHTRDSQLLRLVADAAVAGTYSPKQKYGDVTDTKTWRDLGLVPDAVELV